MRDLSGKMSRNITFDAYLYSICTFSITSTSLVPFIVSLSDDGRDEYFEKEIIEKEQATKEVIVDIFDTIKVCVHTQVDLNDINSSQCWSYSENDFVKPTYKFCAHQFIRKKLEFVKKFQMIKFAEKAPQNFENCFCSIPAKCIEFAFLKQKKSRIRKCFSKSFQIRCPWILDIWCRTILRYFPVYLFLAFISHES